MLPYSFGLRNILIRAKPLPAVKIPGFLKKPHAIPIGITQRVVQSKASWNSPCAKCSVKHLVAVGAQRVGAERLPKTVLISNGVHLARRDETERRRRLLDYGQAGLCVLSLSRHHHDPERNQAIMGVDTRTDVYALGIIL